MSMNEQKSKNLHELTQDVDTILDTLKTKSKLSLKPENDVLNIVFDFFELTNTMQKEFEMGNRTEKQKYVRFFFMGMFSMFFVMLINLWALPIELTFLFYLKYILSVFGTFLISYVATKVKELFPFITKNNEKLKEILQKIVKTIK